MLQTLYFFLFRLSHNYPSKRCFFHLFGAIAFLRSTLKHLKRRNWNMVFDQLKCMFWQLKIALFNF